ADGGCVEAGGRAAQVGDAGARRARAAGRHPVCGQPAEDALGQDHAPPAALGRPRRRDHPGRLHARKPRHPRPAPRRRHRLDRETADARGEEAGEEGEALETGTAEASRKKESGKESCQEGCGKTEDGGETPQACGPEEVGYWARATTENFTVISSSTR